MPRIIEGRVYRHSCNFDDKEAGKKQAKTSREIHSGVEVNEGFLAVHNMLIGGALAVVFIGVVWWVTL